MEISLATLLFISGFLVMLIGSFFFIRHLKKKNSAEASNLRATGGIDDENAYSRIVTTESIANFVRSQGVDTTDAEAYIRMAREAYGQRAYKLAVDYCENAKKILEDSKNKLAKTQLHDVEEKVSEEPTKQVAPVEPVKPVRQAKLAEHGPKGISSRLVNITETEQEDHKMVRLNRDSNGEEIKDLKQLDGLAEEALDNRDNKLPSKFMIQRAREAIANAKKAARPVDEAIAELGIAEESFENNDFDLALSRANRARKMAEGEVPPPIEKKPPAKPAEIEVREDGEEDVEERFFCPSCDGEVNEDSTFCRHCGTKLVEEMLVCPGCDETIPSDSVFCPKCGYKQG